MEKELLRFLKEREFVLYALALLKLNVENERYGTGHTNLYSIAIGGGKTRQNGIELGNRCIRRNGKKSFTLTK